MMRKVLLFVLVFLFSFSLSFGNAFAYGSDAPRIPSRTYSDDREVPSIMPQVAPLPSGTSQEYVLGIGDHIRLTVYGEEDLSGEYEVGSTGIVAMPLIGDIKAANTTIREFEDAVKKELSKGYLRDPRVNVQVTNYRPFFILGEVSKPGSYPFVNGMTVLNAIALAGGYTYRASITGTVIVHANDPSKTEKLAREEDAVMPGDIIRVPERFF